MTTERASLDIGQAASADPGQQLDRLAMKLSSPPADVSDELSALIETLVETSRRVEELTHGEVDTVASRDGQRLLLPRAQEHLRNNELQLEGRYRGLLEAAPDAMVVVNENGVIVLLNVQAEKRFGYHRDELLGQQVTNIIPQGFAERLAADALRTEEDALDQQIGTGIELVGLRKNGTAFPIEIMLSPLRSDEGLLVTAAIRDISGRKVAEDRYRGLLEAAPDAMVVVNENGVIVLLNVQAEKRFGYHRDELLGQQVTNIIPEGFAERLIADALRPAEDALAQQIGTGIELVGLRKNGTAFPIEIMLSPLRSDEGLLVTAAIRDISGRKVAEDRYRGLLEAAPDAMVVVNESGVIVLLNVQAEKRFGYHRDELLGQRVTNIIPEGFAERLVADALRPAEDALAQQIGTGIELTGLRKNGTVFPLELMLSPLKSVEGLLVTAAIRDISVRKMGEEHLQATVNALARSNRELEAFTNLASHDLQQPLRKILAFGSRLESGEQGLTEKGTDYLQRMTGAASRMQALIQNLLSYSRVTAQTDPFVRVPLDTVLADVLADLEVLVESSGATVELGPLPEVDGDATQLRELFQNLLTNAMKFRKEGVAPVVRVSWEQVEAGAASIFVQDNGIGFDMTHAEKIFGMFQRLHGRDAYEGTGIGLAVCRKIAARHGGQVTAASALGAGTRFTVVLPLPRNIADKVGGER